MSGFSRICIHMEDLLSRLWTNLTDRWTGPLSFRFILQPVMATLFAVRDGLKDARAGHPAYLWAIFWNSEERRSLVSDGWKAVGRVFVLAIVMDVIYQLVVFRWFYPGELLSVSIILAIIPYALLRGPINRLARLFLR